MVGLRSIVAIAYVGILRDARHGGTDTGPAYAGGTPGASLHGHAPRAVPHAGYGGWG